MQFGESIAQYLFKYLFLQLWNLIPFWLGNLLNNSKNKIVCFQVQIYHLLWTSEIEMPLKLQWEWKECQHQFAFSCNDGDILDFPEKKERACLIRKEFDEKTSNQNLEVCFKPWKKNLERKLLSPRPDLMIGHAEKKLLWQLKKGGICVKNWHDFYFQFMIHDHHYVDPTCLHFQVLLKILPW